MFWCLISLLVYGNFGAFRHADPASEAGCLLIGFFCMFPLYLWCAGKVQGMPVFPFFALTYLWTFCLPLVSDNPNVLKYSPSQHLIAGFNTSLFLGSGTLVWYQFVKSKVSKSKPYLALDTEKAELFFIVMVGAGVFINMYVLGGWSGIPPKIFTIVRGMVKGLSLLGCFILCYRLGQKEIPKLRGQVFVLLQTLYIITSGAGMVLNFALVLFMLSIVAYTIGARRFPIVATLIGLMCVMPLHYGKHPMREKYWFHVEETTYIQPWDYPAWFREWAGYAYDYFTYEPARYEKVEERESFAERSSVVHMLMFAQTQIPKNYPFLNGETYKVVPQIIMPRIINPNKPRSHEGTYMLCIHTRMQTYEDTLTTTIAWGLLPEAYANFGTAGLPAIGGLLGVFYGTVTRSALGTSRFSFRFLFSVLIFSLSLASIEWTSGVYAATLFQSSVPLLGIRFTVMRLYRKMPHYKQLKLKRKLKQMTGARV